MRDDRNDHTIYAGDLIRGALMLLETAWKDSNASKKMKGEVYSEN